MTATDRLSKLAERYDLLVIGGGITGAGVLREAVRTGASVLLVEARDFASGTSGGSSKLVHGGLRYLQSGQWGLTLESVRERARLLREAPGLVDRQTFLLPVYRGVKPSRALIRAGLLVYDLMAGRLASRWLAADELLRVEPELAREHLLGAMSFEDARTDDSRLVQRLVEDARAAGAVAINYVRVEDLVRDASGTVTGAVLFDAIGKAHRRISSGMVVNATGAWSRQFALATVGAPALRPLRGSHFVYTRDRFPITHAISWLHPRDRRPVFAHPWEGAVIVGTTDLDHDPLKLNDPRMSVEESAYLIEALQARFPHLALTAPEALATYSGVRPVLAGGKGPPSAESRESALWSCAGMVSTTGGKLTTFRVTARKVLAEAARQMPRLMPGPAQPVFEHAPDPSIEPRLSGRLGASAARKLVETLPAAERMPIGDTPYTWAEVRWAARHEQVVHLEDLMMRRTRLGLVTRDGGREHLPRIGEILRDELGWDEAQWQIEEGAYLDRWGRLHRPI